MPPAVFLSVLPGRLVAVALPDPASQQRALGVLRALGNGEIEQAEGELVDGNFAGKPGNAPRIASATPPAATSDIGRINFD